MWISGVQLVNFSILTRVDSIHARFFVDFGKSRRERPRFFVKRFFEYALADRSVEAEGRRFMPFRSSYVVLKRCGPSPSNCGANFAMRIMLWASAYIVNAALVFSRPRTLSRVSPRSRASAFTHSAVEARSL